MSENKQQISLHIQYNDGERTGDEVIIVRVGEAGIYEMGFIASIVEGLS